MSKAPTGVKTNGIGQRTTAHLNLTRSMTPKPKLSQTPGQNYENRFLPASKRKGQ